MKTNFFYDTEFLEDGQTIDLISFGMICLETGEEFYAVNRDADWERIRRHDWLMENVVPSLPVSWDSHGLLNFHHSVEFADILPKEVIRTSLMDFVDRNQKDGTKNRFWAWYGDYDHVAMAQLFGPMIGIPQNFPKFTMDLRQYAEHLDNPSLPDQAEGEHNALEDARHNIVRYKFLKEIEKEKWRK